MKKADNQSIQLIANGRPTPTMSGLVTTMPSLVPSEALFKFRVFQLHNAEMANFTLVMEIN